MTMQNKEAFYESLVEHYRDDVKMVINECQTMGKSYLDIDALNEKLLKLHDFAMNEGLNEDDWLDLVYEVAPEVYNKLDFGNIAA
jgi:hypothetical protein